MPCRSPLVVEPSSHISRKNAIIAVTKSAYAIFHAAAWAPWPFFLIRRMTIGRSLSFMRASVLVLLLDVRLELGEARAVRRVQHLATEFDGDGRRVAGQRCQQRHLHALEDLARLGGFLRQQARQWADDPIREQDAEERADQRMRDQDPQLGG